MNGNGPNSAADPWTALGDIAGTIAPAIMGAQIGQGEGGGGAAMGALDAIGRTVDRRREMAKEDADTKYRQALMQEADIRAQELEMKLAENKRALANKDAYLATLPEDERAVAAVDLEKHLDMKTKQSEQKSAAKLTSLVLQGQIPEDVAAGLPIATQNSIISKFGPMALSGGAGVKVQPIDLGNGKQAQLVYGFAPNGESVSELIKPPVDQGKMTKTTIDDLAAIGITPADADRLPGPELQEAIARGRAKRLSYKQEGAKVSAIGTAEGSAIGAAEVGAKQSGNLIEDYQQFIPKILVSRGTGEGVLSDAATTAKIALNRGDLARRRLAGDPTVQAWDSFTGRLANVARQMGEKGALSDSDREWARLMVPVDGDSQEGALEKLGYFYKASRVLLDEDKSPAQKKAEFERIKAGLPPYLRDLGKANPGLDADTNALRGRFSAPPAQAGGISLPEGWSMDVK